MAPPDDDDDRQANHAESEAPAPDGNDDDGAPSASLIDALLVYAEPLAANAHAVVLGDAESSVANRLLDLGARSVYVFDPDPARAANAARVAPRGVTVRPLVDDLDVRDGAFDLAVVPDLSEVNDPRGSIERLRRAVAVSGAVVAMGRAKLRGEEEMSANAPFAAELGPAVLEYAELYDLFATQFDEVTLAGVVPFAGAVFAELGVADDEDDDAESPAVSVDTRLAITDSPSVFVVVAGQRSDRKERPTLDPYSIVQIPARANQATSAAAKERIVALEAAFAAAQLKADLLTSQLDEVRDRLTAADARTVEAVSRLERAGSERDSALTRAMELEAVLAASQQTMATLERRLLEAEQGMLERDDRIAALSAELDARQPVTSSETPFLGTPALTENPDMGALLLRAERAELALAAALAELSNRQETEATVAFNVSIPELRERAERAEAALAIAVAELANRQETDTTIAFGSAVESIPELKDRAERAEAAVALAAADYAQAAESHLREMAGFEEQLRDRARVVAALEKELFRREMLVRELVSAIEDRDRTLAVEGDKNGSAAVIFEAAAPLSNPNPNPPSAHRPAQPDRSEEIAKLRRKLDELAAEVARREGEIVARGWRIEELENHLKSKPAAAAVAPPPKTTPVANDELGKVRDELDALRQALAQEHEARVAAESGEELARARSELARQAALLEQMRNQMERSS